MRETILGVLVLLSLAGQPAKAILIPATAPGFGPNSLTIDTATGLGWLDLTASAGLSYQQVLADTQPGGIFSGFRFATSEEVLGLYAAAGIAGPGTYSATDPAILSFISLVGGTSSQDGHPETFGISAFPDGLDSHFVPGIDFFYHNGNPQYQVTGVPHQAGDLSYGNGTASLGVGSWLVASVPETADASIYLLAGAGLLGFGFLVRRRNS